MTKSPSQLKTRLLNILLTGVMLAMVWQGALSQPASAQGLMNRIRARIESRMGFPPPPPGTPARPLGYRPPASVAPPGGVDGRQSSNYRLPAGTPNSAPTASLQRPRVLATPTTDQNQASQQALSQRLGGGDAAAEPTLGIEIVPVAIGRERGLEIQGFRPDSRLPEVGIRRGDVIVAMDGQRTDSMASMITARRQIPPGGRATMQIVRAGQLYQVRLPAWPAADAAGIQSDAVATADPARMDSALRSAAKPPVEGEPAEDGAVWSSPIESPNDQAAQRDLPKYPDLPAGPTLARPRASLGIKAGDASPQRGVIVVEVSDGSAGKVGGLHVDDRIVSAAGRLVRDTGGLIRELALTQPGDSLTLGVVRGDTMRELVVEMGDREGRPVQGANSLAKADRDQTVTPAEASDQGGAESPQSNLLNGVGAALGNFFGGGASTDSASPQTSGNVDAAAGQRASQSDQVEHDSAEESANVFELPAPAPEGGSQPNDPLALPDDE